MNVVLTVSGELASVTFITYRINPPIIIIGKQIAPLTSLTSSRPGQYTDLWKVIPSKSSTIVTVSIRRPLCVWGVY